VTPERARTKRTLKRTKRTTEKERQDAEE